MQTDVPYMCSEQDCPPFAYTLSLFILITQVVLLSFPQLLPSLSAHVLFFHSIRRCQFSLSAHSKTDSGGDFDRVFMFG